MARGRVAGLSDAIDAHLRAIFDAALAVPPGGGKAWDQLLGHYGITPDPPKRRFELARDLKMTRGATPDEVTRALEGLAAWANGELRALASDPACLAEPGFPALGARIASLAHFEAQRYRELVVPKAAPSVSSIFANAQATAGLTPWADVKTEDSLVLSCGSCGGPQEVQASFTCRYCGSRLGAT